jgi:DNA invertase Pin-like site-specific DNA recombinase
MVLGYIWVSQCDGAESRCIQRGALIAAGVSPLQIHEDAASGRCDTHPGLASTLTALQLGDTLVVWKLDSLGRNLRHLVSTIHILTTRGIGLKVLAGHGAAIDTTTPSAPVILELFHALADFDRDLVSQRTHANLTRTRARGRNGGAPFKMTTCKLLQARNAMARSDTKVSDLCRELGISRQTLYRHVGPDGVIRKDGEKLLRAMQIVT